MERVLGIVCLMCGLALSACGDRQVLRDDYLGKSVVQPQKVQGPQPRDANGNPVFAPAERGFAWPWFDF